ncbi:hypothetical protein [Cellulomonas sp. PhB150]|uniref:hypothetical protein n=1 Tax=Cellulomonas sp. PhB150 TaxID=2485188 RepID=UPI000FB52F92|nr:hypothetical protein [Cellulomonas sp. PhB150]ROS30573.1 hypothetical protein EDF34_0212 [Cellulomonas sp. PhB150]
MRRAARLGVACTLALTLGACGSPTDLTAETARSLQADVLSVTTAAAGGKWDAVDSGVAATRADLDAALDAGEISTARYREVDAALDRVAAEAEDVQDRAAAAEKAEAAAATAKATATATPTVAPPTSTTKEPAAPPSSTKGKGHDNGKGPKHPPKPKKNK